MIKISDLRPCDNCGKAISPTFYVVRFSLAVINFRALSENVGLMTMFHGSVALAETMTSQPEVVTVTGDKDKSLEVEAYICTDCFVQGVNLAHLQSLVEARENAKAGKR